MIGPPKEPSVPDGYKNGISVPFVSKYGGRIFYEIKLLIKEISPHIKILQKFRVLRFLVSSKEDALWAILSGFWNKSKILKKPFKESRRKNPKSKKNFLSKTKSRMQISVGGTQDMHLKSIRVPWFVLFRHTSGE